MKLLVASMFTLFAAVSHTAVAAPIVTTTTQYNTGFAVSSTDLLQTNLASASFSGSFVHESGLGTPAFNNGVYGLQGNQSGWTPGGSQAATADGNNVATFNLAGAFDLTAIDTYAGWDAYRGGQHYSVWYATAAQPLTYVQLASVFTNPVGGGNVNTHAAIRDNANGFLARDVVSLRFNFGGALAAGYSGYREIDVQGTAVQVEEVPEPASIALIGLGLAGIASLRRRARRA